MDEKDIFDGLQVENLFDIVQVEEEFKKCGIDIKNKDGDFKSLSEVFEELSKRWGDYQSCHDYIISKSIDKFTENLCRCDELELGQPCEYKFKNYKQFDMVSWLSKKDL